MGAPGAPSLLVAYDAFADAEAWSPAGVRSSYVSLSAGPGHIPALVFILPYKCYQPLVTAEEQSLP